MAGVVEIARDRALAHLLAQQSSRGDWEGEMVWCPMITAQYVLVHRIAGRPVDAATREGIVRYFQVSRTAEGAWGLHPESPGGVFVTTLVYVALRLLGVGPDEAMAKDARAWLERRGGDGVLALPTWGKFWLALIGLYGWSGVHPCPPELFLLPRWLPLHPARYYCHTRYIYLAMAYLWGRRFTADLGPARDELAHELYGAPLAALDFAACRDRIAASDLHVAPGRLLRLARRGLSAWEHAYPRRVRARALDRCLAAIVYEQHASRSQGLSPVSGLLNCVALFAADPRHPALQPSLAGLEAWRWQDAAGGVRFAGARSNTWDTAFALEALVAGGAQAAAPVQRGYAFLQGAQITSELPSHREEDRDAILGGWCFSDGAHRWPVSDCAAEAVSALLAVEAAPSLAPDPALRIPRDRLRRAADFILARQNADGGFGTYERRRAPLWLECTNPSEMFGRCMTERSYVECTASALVALGRLRETEPSMAEPGTDRAITRGAAFLRGTQRPDGSVPGFWGINFTYGAFHFARGLRAAGAPAEDPQLRRAAAWLVAHQRGDGGWGEHFSGCLSDTYVEHPESQTVMTSWALLALFEILGSDAEPVRRGIAWLVARQDADGGFPAGAVNGVFFGTAMLDYRLYPVYFPAWALARFCAATPRA